MAKRTYEKEKMTFKETNCIFGKGKQFKGTD